MHVTPLTLRLCAAAVVVGLVLAAEGRCEEAAAPEPAPEPLILEAYNVVDLACRSDHPAPSPPITVDYGPDYETGLGPGFDGLRHCITRLINQTSDSGVATWGEEGGTANIEYMRGVLIVTQTAHGHERLKQLLGALRKERGPLCTVTVRARWVLLDPAKARELLGGAAAKSESPIEVAEEALQKADASAAYEGVATCINGQTTFVMAGRTQSDLNLGKIRTPASNTAADEMASGAFLQVRPTILPDRDAAMVDVIAEVSKVKSPEVAYHIVHTGVVVPLGKTVLLGGMTAPNAKKGEVMYLVLRVSATK